MFRLYYRIFWWNKPEYHHAPHDAPMTMSIPLIFLALVSCVAGFIPFGEFVTYNGAPYHIHLNYAVAGVSVAVAITGIIIATILYRKENSIPDQLANRFKGLWTAAYNRFYIDQLYLFITHKIIFGGICKPIAWFDRHIVDGTMNMFANVTNSTAFAIRKLQSGNIQMYVWIYLIGALTLALITWLCLI